MRGLHAVVVLAVALLHVADARGKRAHPSPARRHIVPLRKRATTQCSTDEPTLPPSSPATSIPAPPASTETTPPPLPSSSSSALLSMKYAHLPLGAVKPAGWLLDQLKIQADGLAGHEHDFYGYVKDSTWEGGSATYSDLQEGGSYWFNGMVAHAFVLDDDRLKGQVQGFLDYIIAHQGVDGWIGPEPRKLWGRYPVMIGMMQFAEADPAQTDKIVDSMLKFAQLAHDMIANDADGVEEWGAARYQEFTLVVEWLYDNHPNGRGDMLLDLMKLLKSTGTDWTPIFDPANFPQGDTGSDARITWHGVNIAQALKARAVEHRFTQAVDDHNTTNAWWDILYKYHGRPTGVFAADEHLAGLSPNRGTELCTVVELMYSGSFVYQAFGDNRFADLVEKMTYNALPATLTGDMWAHQYLQQLNQISAKHLDPNPFLTDGPDSNVFGLEPNYPCCAVNHPQGWPKFVSNAFVTTPDGASLVQVYLGPFDVQTALAGSNAVHVAVDTQYPFSDVLTITIDAGAAYTHYVRIPDWATAAGKASVAINGGSAENVVVDGDSLLAISAAKGQTTAVLTLPADISTTTGTTGGVQVSRGPLFWSSDIFHTTTVTGTNALEPRAQDFAYDANAPWAFAIDPNTLEFRPNTLNGSLPVPVFDSQRPPVQIHAVGCPIDWTTAGAPPSSVACKGDKFDFIFWPYGSTKLRVGELPPFDSSK